jgi:NarL family two-component system sensor histidine kinase LiaS
MNTIQRQIVWGVGLSLILTVLLLASYFVVFPPMNWEELWNRKLMDIPFALFVPSVSIAIGIIFGFGSGLSWKNSLYSVDRWLHEIVEGRSVAEENLKGSTDVLTIADKVGKVQRLIAEQAKITQKLANEKAEDQENRIQEIISEERNRLARELHDSVSQQLFAASMLMSAINETGEMLDDPRTKQLKMVESMIHQSQLEMRALLLHLRPVALKGKTLQQGVEELLIELTQKVTMNIEWKVESFPVEKGIEDHLFRILQESVSNTLRHSKANKLEVLLIKRDEWVILRVADDGVGFDVEGAKAGSYGLQNMNERAVEIGGTMKIISIKNQGTRLEVKIPILEEKGEDHD